MAENHENRIIHIVSFNVPYPPDYGGVMDVFYKIAALKRQGVGVILHCFTYGRARSRTLEKECLKVYYYNRDLNLFHLFSRDPFIVISRKNRELLNHLAGDSHPIIFEGLHTTYYLDHPALEGRMKMVRTHNIEHIYYRNLARNERNPLRRYFYLAEALKLEHYEARLSAASLLLSISPGDTDYFRERFGHTLFVGPFHPSDECRSVPGRGKYILIHGDFSTPENNAAALYLLKHAVNKWNHRTVIAGKRPSEELLRLASSMNHVEVIPNPSISRMSELLTDSHICLLHALQPTGMKLKLINALCYGRHVIASPQVVSGTRLDSLCTVASSPSEWISRTDKLMKEEFTAEHKTLRTKNLCEVADNSVNARRITESINNHNGRLS